MKIEQLEQLIKIVECGSMNTAAEEMYLARSSLSTSMKRLEEELGEPVFIRHSNGVNLTPFGSTVYNHAREICSRIQFLREGLVQLHALLIELQHLFQGKLAFLHLADDRFQL